MKRTLVLAGTGSLLALSLLLWVRPPWPGGEASERRLTEEFTPEEIRKIFEHSPLGPAQADPTNAVGDNPLAADLGQVLFFDPRLSRDLTVSCATCHIPARGFTDGRAMVEAFHLPLKVPTLWNVAWNRWFFWDGRSDSLWAQALKPLENPREHGGSRLQVVHLVDRDRRLKSRYERVFGALPDLSDPRRFPPQGGPIHDPARPHLEEAWRRMSPEDRETVDRIFAKLGKSIAAYERRLVSRRSRFDVFVEGLRDRDPRKQAALSPRERSGLKLFIGRGQCRLCHSGPNFTDGEFHNLGLLSGPHGPPPSRDRGLLELSRDPFNSKGIFSDDRLAGEEKLNTLSVNQDLWGEVKTPGLRNVALTSPYMHQGQFTTLGDVVRFYSDLRGMVQAGDQEHAILVPLRLRKDEAEALVAFLESLTDETLEPRLKGPIRD